MTSTPDKLFSKVDWIKNPEMVNMLRIENAMRPEHLEQIPKNKWPRVQLPQGLKEVWRSRYYLVQVFHEKNGIERLSINIADVDAEAGRWKDGISWDALQEIKRQVGRGDKDAVEIFPKDADIVNVANIRHLFVMPDDLPYAWRKEQRYKHTEA